MKIRLPDGTHILGAIAVPHPNYDNVGVRIKGYTALPNEHRCAWIEVEIGPKEALIFAMQLIYASDKLGENTRKSAASLVKRMAKSMNKEAKK